MHTAIATWNHSKQVKLRHKKKPRPTLTRRVLGSNQFPGIAPLS